MKPGGAFRVEIESLDQEGRGVGHRDGKAVFVEGALPGESVLYERRRDKPSYEVGRIIAIERASVLRTVPRCPHFGLGAGACGGCSMQHLDARAQVSVKQRVLEDSLWHIGRVRAEHHAASACRSAVALPLSRKADRALRREKGRCARRLP